MSFHAVEIEADLLRARRFRLFALHRQQQVQHIPDTASQECRVLSPALAQQIQDKALASLNKPSSRD